MRTDLQTYNGNNQSGDKQHSTVEIDALTKIEGIAQRNILTFKRDATNIYMTHTS